MIKAFKLCGFEVPALIAMRAVSPSWEWAADFCLDEVVKLLACLPTHVFSTVERELLWQNRRHFVGHSRWLVQLLHSMDWGDRYA